MLNQQQQKCLDALGINIGIQTSQKPQVFNFLSKNKNTLSKPLRKETTVFKQLKDVTPNQEQPDNQKISIQTSFESNEALNIAISQCKNCPDLLPSRQQAIIGQGDLTANLLIISEAPNDDEDLKNQVFTGTAGLLFDNMLNAIELNRNKVFTTHIVKCKPANNRDPYKEEFENCSHYIEAQIKFIQPKVILALGRVAAQQLLKTKSPVTQLREQTHQHSSETPIIVSYHPAYLLRNKNKKRESWIDLIKTFNLLKE